MTGSYFEDVPVDDVQETPGLTITSAHVAIYLGLTRGLAPRAWGGRGRGHQKHAVRPPPQEPNHSRRPRSRRGPRVLQGDRLHRRRLEEAPDRRGALLDRDHAVQLEPPEDGREGEGG